MTIIIILACDCCVRSHFTLLIATEHSFGFSNHTQLNRLGTKLDKCLVDAAKKIRSNCRVQPHIYGEPAIQ